MATVVVKHIITIDSLVCPAVKEAAVQRRHNLYRDSIILTNSDPNLHLLEDKPPADWVAKFGGDEADNSVDGGAIEGGGSSKRRRQVVSMIQLDGLPLPYESCMEVPGVELIPEEDPEMLGNKEEDRGEDEEEGQELPENPKSPDSVNEIRGLINPVVEMMVPVSEEKQSDVTKSTDEATGTIVMEDGVEEDVTHVTTVVDSVPRKSPRERSSPQTILQELKGNKGQETDMEQPEETAVKDAIEEIEIAVQEADGEQITEVSAAESDSETSLKPPPATDSSIGGDSGFQSPTNEGLEEGEPQPEAVTKSVNGEDKIINPAEVEVVLV